MIKILSSVDFWEIRQGSALQNGVSVVNGDVKNISLSEKKGFSIRVLDKGRWGFAYGENSTLADIAKRAVSIARAMKKSDFEIPPTSAWKGNFKAKPKINPEDIDSESVVKRLKEEHHNTARTFSTDYQFTKRNINYKNSHGSSLSQELLYSSVYVKAGVKIGAHHEQFENKIGDQVGYELLRNLSRVSKETISKAKELCKAKLPKGGKFTVVCDPVLVDVLIHEAFGHAAEGDIVLSKESCLADKMGHTLSSDEVSIVDDSTIPGRWGSFHFDDEGTRAQKTSIIKKGVLESFMHSRETAARLDAKPTGNGRAEGVSSMPCVRMSNTNLQKGSHSESELFKGIKHGVFLCGSSGGQVDTAKGNFQFNSRYGYEIVNGKKGAPLKGVSIQGNTLEMLNNISAVGNKIHLGLPGSCGKMGQLVPVLGINPMVRLKNAILGGSK